MIQLQRKLRKARVWFEVLPFVEVTPTTMQECRLPAPLSGRTEGRMVAVELCWPVGPFAVYGMLGVEFMPDKSSELAILVSVSDSNGPMYLDSLALPSDSVRFGLPEEYATAVTESACNPEIAAKLGAGKLLFRCAAHGLVGSNPIIFAKLVTILVDLATIEPQFVPNEEHLVACLGL